MASPRSGMDVVQDVAEDQLRSIFDLCDDDGDGLVAVADLRRREEMRGYDKVRSRWRARSGPRAGAPSRARGREHRVVPLVSLGRVSTELFRVI